MEFLYKKNLSECGCEAAVFGFYKSEGEKKIILPHWVNISNDEFDGSLGKLSLVRNAQIGEKTYPKAVLVGLGEPKKCDTHLACTTIAGAFSYLKFTGAKSIAINFEKKEWASRLASQIGMADYSFTKYKSETCEKKVGKIFFVCPSDVSSQIQKGKIFSEASNFARSIQNEPANVASPDYVSKIAKEMSLKKGLKCTILNKKDLQKEKMEAMLAVASGSVNEARLVVMQYFGNKNSEETDVAIVGKGVTFDSGGISIKPSASMDEMKFDKSGACATIAIMSALKELGVKKNVVGIAALVENMPSSKAYRPGDILRVSNSKTIEVLNTDAEGRVVLADALSYTCKKFNPKHLIDLATLTGACVVALGDLTAGIMCEDDKLCHQLIASGHESGERVWRLPSWVEYDEKVKSEIADVKNIGESGNAGPISGFSFLRPFTSTCPSWAHIDIAGTSSMKKPKWGLGVGGSGFGVRLCLEYLLI